MYDDEDFNVSYSPEKFGLEPIFQMELRDEPYEFDMYGVWKHVETGKYYFASTSGCSCPVPFEEYTKLEDLTLIDTKVKLELLDEAISWKKDTDEWRRFRRGPALIKEWIAVLSSIE